MLDFKWDKNGRWRYATTIDNPGEIEIPDHQLRHERISRHDPDVGKETLGVYLAPDGNNCDQLKNGEGYKGIGSTNETRIHVKIFSGTISSYKDNENPRISYRSYYSHGKGMRQTHDYHSEYSTSKDGHK